MLKKLKQKGKVCSLLTPARLVVALVVLLVYFGAARSSKLAKGIVWLKIKPRMTPELRGPQCPRWSLNF